jgi:hypothetical protein
VPQLPAVGACSAGRSNMMQRDPIRSDAMRFDAIRCVARCKAR